MPCAGNGFRGRSQVFSEPREHSFRHVEQMRTLFDRVVFSRIDDEFCRHTLVFECSVKRYDCSTGTSWSSAPCRIRVGVLRFSWYDSGEFVLESSSQFVRRLGVVDRIPVGERTLAVEAEPVRNPGSHHRRSEAIRLRDGPGCCEAAIIRIPTISCVFGCSFWRRRA